MKTSALIITTAMILAAFSCTNRANKNENAPAVGGIDSLVFQELDKLPQLAVVVDFKIMNPDTLRSNFYFATSEPINNSCINQTDEFGRKTGLWMEEAYGFHEKYMVFVFYIDGKKNGIARYYAPHKKNQIGGIYRHAYIGSYQDDIEVGQWQVFNSPAGIETIIDSISENTRFLEEGELFYNGSNDSIMQCYVRYYDVGKITCEGWKIYHRKQFPFDDGIRVGDWTYYNEDGSKWIDHNPVEEMREFYSRILGPGIISFQLPTKEISESYSKMRIWQRMWQQSN